MIFRLFTAVLIFCITSAPLPAAVYTSTNFEVDTGQQEDAEQFARAAEFYREQLARVWLGKKLPDWSKPCRVQVNVTPVTCRGSTTYMLQYGEASDFAISIHASHERVLDSVLPHEVWHTVVATHLGRVCPRWLDEGAATSVEHLSQRRILRRRCEESAFSEIWFSVASLLKVREYPGDHDKNMQFYYQSAELVAFLLQCGEDDAPEGHCNPARFARKKLLRFERRIRRQGAEKAVRMYGFRSIEELEQAWRAELLKNWI